MQDVASAKRVYSDPHEKDGVTVVPAGPSHQGERMYEPITVEVARGYGKGTYRSYTINFTGRLIKTIQAANLTMTLYE